VRLSASSRLGEGVLDPLRVARIDHEAGVAEHPHMPRDSRLREFEGLDEFAHAGRAHLQTFEDSKPRHVFQGAQEVHKVG